jgi:8-oxo-dGTP diphosphatase
MMKSINVVAAIIRKDGKVLATQRGYGEFEGGWEFPGGKIESGETPEQAIVREIDEELDASIAVEKLVADVHYDYDTFHLDMDCFLCGLTDPSITLLEHSAAKWLDAEHLRTVDWLPADIQVIEVIEAQKII